MITNGSKDPIDFTISNAIYDLMGGKPEGEVADDLGWELRKIMNIHPMTISGEKLMEIADEQHWPQPHLRELLQSIENYRTRLNIEEAKVKHPAPQCGDETNPENNEIIPMLGMTLDEWHRVLHQATENKKKEDEWRETVALQLETMKLTDVTGSVRQKLLRELRKNSSTSDRYARAVKIMMELIPLGLNRSLGARIHLLASVSREYKAEHDLLVRAIKEARRP